MIIVKVHCGFGNQLFMYACGYAVARRLNVPLKLNISSLATDKKRNYELDKLNIRYDEIFDVDAYKFYHLKVLARCIQRVIWSMKYKYFKEKKGRKYDEDVMYVKDNTYISGYWQTEKYFKVYRKALLEMFTPKYALSDGCKSYMESVGECESVALHIRRGDYLKYGLCLDKVYYEKSLDIMNERVNNPVYYVFSDDVAGARKLLESRERVESFVFVEYESANPTLDDFFIMKSCKHNIVANSTYSWWAAWLNENPKKVVVRPQEIKFVSGSEDFYPEEWIAV